MDGSGVNADAGAVWIEWEQGGIGIGCGVGYGVRRGFWEFGKRRGMALNRAEKSVWGKYVKTGRAHRRGPLGAFRGYPPEL